MKAKVIIEDGSTKIRLTPETTFEETLVRDIERSNYDWTVITETKYNTLYGHNTKDIVITSKTSNK